MRLQSARLTIFPGSRLRAADCLFHARRPRGRNVRTHRKDGADHRGDRCHRRQHRADASRPGRCRRHLRHQARDPRSACRRSWRTRPRPAVQSRRRRARRTHLVPRAEEAMGQLDVLVANAGVARDNLLVQLRDEDWEQVIAINLSATFRLSRAAVRGMMRRRFGRIIAITSVVGTTGNPGQVNYVAAKAGIAGMIKAIAQEYAKRGVTANCVAPGFIVTPMTDKAQRQAARSHIGENSSQPRRHARGSRRRCRLPRLQRGRLCDRADIARQRRNGHDLKAIREARTARGRAGQRGGSVVTEPRSGWGNLESRRAGQQISASDRCRPAAVADDETKTHSIGSRCKMRLER